MNDEIKEILDLLNFNRDVISNGICYVEDFMSRKQIIKLLDYITNLQEENEKYKIFEGKERFSKIMPEDIDFIILSKSDYDRQEKDIQLELIDYKSRCEKAIDFVKKESKKCYSNQTTDSPTKVIGNFMWHTDKLLNILNGGAE